MKIKYDENLIKYISVFESITNTKLKDCIAEDDRLLFIVEEGQIGKAIGKQGSNIRRLEDLLKKRVKLAEFSNSPAQIVRRLLYPHEVGEISEDNGNIIISGRDTQTRSLIIGRERRNLISLTNTVKRFFDINEIKVV